MQIRTGKVGAGQVGIIQIEALQVGMGKGAARTILAATGQ